MSETERSLYEELLDIVVFAPVGAALKAVELIPELVSKGRERLGGPIATSNAVGHVAIGTARRVITGFVSKGATNDGTGARAVTGTDVRPRNSVDATGIGRSDRASAGPEIDAAELAIIGYDTLAASQIVDALSGLAGDDLELIRRYEQQHRGRRTILSRIVQLQEG